MIRNSTNPGFLNVRYPFSKQPAHCIIIDLTSVFTADSRDTLCDGINRFFTVVCNMTSGQSRVPFVSILAMSHHTEVLLPFQRLLKPLCSRIGSAVVDLKTLITSRLEDQKYNVAEIDPKIYEHTIRDTDSQFKKIKGSAGSLTKLDITMISCHNVEKIQNPLTQALSKLSLSDIRHINAVCLAIEGRFSSFDIESSQSPNDSLSDNNLDLTGILSVHSLECDELSIEALFREWLHDRSTDREHIHLLFPVEVYQEKYAIKCDLKERIIDPSELPFHNRLEIPLTGHDFTSTIPTGRPLPKAAEYVAIASLNIVKRVPMDSVCESVVFGKPLLLCNSSCWQMEWEELETNQTRFNALCRSLSDNNECLIAENDATVQGNKRGPAQKLPTGLFVIMASETLGSLLLKSIASRDILMSCQVPVLPKWDTISSSSMEEINHVLKNVEHASSFNPLLFKIGLPESLQPSFTTNTAPANKMKQRGMEIPKKQCAKRGWQKEITNPATGKAARFMAPRVRVTDQYDLDPDYNPKAPKYSVSSKKNNANLARQLKNISVTFDDFHNF